MNVQSRIALVTGATRGIGLGAALIGADGPSGTFRHLGETQPW